MDLSDFPGGLACPSRASSWVTHPPQGVSHVASDLLCRHAVAITPVGPQGGIGSLPCSLRQRPSPFHCRVGSHVGSFEACSAFTHVTACLLAEPLTALSIESFGDIVTSIAAPIATGWSESCRVGIAPTEDRRLCTAHKMTSHLNWSSLILKSLPWPQLASIQPLGKEGPLDVRVLPTNTRN